VSEIVQTRSTAGVWGPQSDLSGQLAESVPDLIRVQAKASLRNKEIGEGAPKSSVTLPHVVRENFLRGDVNGHQTGLTEFGSDDDENTFPQVHILWPQVKRFTDPQAGDGQKTKDAIVS